jgi:hypothetical protein
MDASQYVFLAISFLCGMLNKKQGSDIEETL